jgi:two-component system, OmpR family, response regulator
MVHILVVDDEQEARTLLRRYLEVEGYEISEAANGAELRSLIEATRFDLITLDLHLGADDGLVLAREIRGKRNIPIIMITGKGDPVDRVVGLELGADDYIAKPVHLREVLARVRAVLRRYQPIAESQPQDAGNQGPRRLAFDDWVLDIKARALIGADGQSQPLTTAEFDLLKLLITMSQRVLSRDEIMQKLKGHDWSPGDRTIDTIVKRLRRKIEPNVDIPRHIKSVRNVGYVFATEVKQA